MAPEAGSHAEEGRDVNEADYWAALEYRVCREFAGMRDRHLRYLWCDGFIPEQYALDGPSPSVAGRAWVGDGPRQQEWDFVLFLDRPYGSPQEIDWRRLLPAENMTRWLSADPAKKSIQIEPSAATPDAV
jgi:hypothetical protein